MTYEVENPSPVLGQAQKYGGLKTVNGKTSWHFSQWKCDVLVSNWEKDDDKI
jgi:hypothetical protein